MASPAATVAKVAYIASANDLSNRFGGSELGNTLSQACKELASEFVDFIDATVHPVEGKRSAGTRLMATERAGRDIAMALLEYANRRFLPTTVKNGVATTLQKFVVLLLETSTEYYLKNYESSTGKYIELLTHIIDEMGPLLESIIEPNDAAQLEMLRLLRQQ